MNDAGWQGSVIPHSARDRMQKDIRSRRDDLNKDILLSVKNVTKKFPGVIALDDVTLDLYKGEVLALMGENGAGKSTLLKIISGAYSLDEGEFLFEGERITGYSIKKAEQLGIRIIYQELDYFEDLTVAENIYVNNLPKKRGIIDWAKLHVDAEKVISKIGIKIDTHEKMRHLSVAEQQMVEIAKALSQNMKLLIMDEPTAALNDAETETLLELVRKLAEEGVGIIFISHKMKDLFKVADRFQVLRNGKSVFVQDADKTSEDEIILHMVGRDIKEVYPVGDRELGEEILRVEHLAAGKMKDVSFSLKRGEILGIFGLMGSGAEDIAKALFGARKVQGGEILLKGNQVRIRSPKSAMKQGIAYVPSERKKEGLVLRNIVSYNIVLTSLKKMLTRFCYDKKKELKIAKDWIEELRIKTPSASAVVENLSGGNQQKIVIAKWLETDPDILILCEPTRGIDIGAKVEIYKIMEKLSREGKSIVMISSEIPETLGVTDRIMIISEGKNVGILDKKEADQQLLLKYAMGGNA